MIKEIDHIGIAVNNLEEAISIYTDILGLESKGAEKIEEQKIILATILVGGIKIELLQSTHPDGAIGKFIKKKGEGVHHIAFIVENIDESLKKLTAKGVNLIDEKARFGAGGAKIAFIHPKDMKGVLIELVERAKGK
ncbi:MAG: methylmalonyl-CoA epimerase [Thermoplasmatales archaeon]|nr:MAG: methylmalonyl-CoA epimerase [Thermoplasmatales archaeon]